jgi:GNAT superfamily N-acetyltransferase
VLNGGVSRQVEFYYNVSCRMNLLQTTTLTLAQQEQLRQLWNQEYPGQLAFAEPIDFEQWLAKLTQARHWLLVGDAGGVRGWLAVFERDHAPWFVLLVDSAAQGRGHGTVLLTRGKAHETELNGWVVPHDDYRKANGGVYRSPVAFYEKNGFAILAEQPLDSPTLSAIRIRWSR